MRKILKGAAISLAALGTIGLMSTSVSADEAASTRGSDEKINVYYEDVIGSGRDYAGYVKFTHAKDKFTLYRQTSPGNRIYLEYARKGSNSFSTLVGPYESGAKKVHDLNLKEGKVYKFRGCLQVDDLPDDCSKYQHFTA